MSYHETCDEHGQYKGDYCGGCVVDMETENAKLKVYLLQALAFAPPVVGGDGRKGDRSGAGVKCNATRSYQIVEQEHGEFRYREGDITGIDRRVWVELQPSSFRIRAPGGRLLPRVFSTEAQARKWRRGRWK